jgi:hypothetical protein
MKVTRNAIWFGVAISLVLIIVLALTLFATHEIVRPPELRPFHTLQTGEYHLVDGVAYSPDGKLLATAAFHEITNEGGKLEYPGEVKVWRVEDDSLLYTAAYSDTPMVFFSPDGQTLAVAECAAVEYRRASDGVVLRRLTGEKIGCRVSFSSDWHMFVSYGTGDNVERLWQASDGKMVRTFVGHTDIVYGAAFSPDGAVLATASYDKTVILWRVSDGTEIKTLIGHDFWVGRVVFSPDGATLISAEDMGSGIRFWKIPDGQLIRTLDFSVLSDIAVSHDGQFLAVGSSFDLGRVWQTSDGKAVADLVNEEGRYATGGKVLAVTFSPDGKIVAGGTDESTVRFWKVPERTR